MTEHFPDFLYSNSANELFRYEDPERGSMLVKLTGNYKYGGGKRAQAEVEVNAKGKP